MTDDSLSRKTSILLLVLTATLWSLGGLLIKWVRWNPMAIAGSRSAIAAIIIFLHLQKPLFTWSGAQIGGAIAYAATVILFVAANKLTTAANTILLQYTAPVYIALFGAWYLGEKTRRQDWIVIVVTLGGMALFFVDRLSTDNVYGNGLAIASGVAFAWMALFLRKQKHGSPLESILLGNILTVLMCAPFMAGNLPDGEGVLGLVLLGVFQLGIPYILYSIAIRHVTALEAILIPVIEPILNPVWVLLLLGETPGSWSILGGIVVLGAVTARSVFFSDQHATTARPRLPGKHFWRF